MTPSHHIDNMAFNTPALSAIKIKRDPSQGIHEDYQTDEHNTSNASVDDNGDSDALNKSNHIYKESGGIRTIAAKMMKIMRLSKMQPNISKTCFLCNLVKKLYFRQ